MAPFSALLGFCHLIDGFTNRQLVERASVLLNASYTSRQATRPVAVWLIAGCLALALAGCGRGDGASPAAVTVRGTVTFDLVPVVARHGVGLDHDATEIRPARGVAVELIGTAGGSDGEAVLETTITDDAGAYVFPDLPPNLDVRVRVRAEMRRSGTPGWSFSVRDNTSGDALYTLDGEPFSTGAGGATRDLHAGSGWTGSGYTQPRAAAPFAILDVVHDMLDLVLDAEPDAELAPLRIHWSPANAPVLPASRVPNPDTGEIGTAFFSPAMGGIFLLGAEDEDTDEYDRHVIAHELGHYYEWALSRLDSIGGPHGIGDQLDKRVAFSEGWSNAFAALVTGETRYVDVFGPGQSAWLAFDVAGSGNGRGPANPGWFSAFSVHEIVHAVAAPDGMLGFGPVHDVLRGPHRATEAQASIFSFVDALKASHPAEAPALDALVSAQAIQPVADAWGSGETNAGHPPHPDVLPVYHELAVNQGPRNVCSTDAFGAVNKVGARQFLRFSVMAVGRHTLSATATDMPSGTHADPDMVLHRGGVVRARSEGRPSEQCRLVVDPAACLERFAPSLVPGEYVLEVYEWTNTNDHAHERPPIGRACFDVEITQP